MSDPVSNAEVEDVLSSIRRLVSEDKRPMQKRAPDTAKDRLVLTPSLRVEDEKPEEPFELSSDEVVFFDQTSDDPVNEPLNANDPVAEGKAAETEPARDELENDYDSDPYGFDSADDEIAEHDDDLEQLEVEPPDEYEDQPASDASPDSSSDKLTQLLDELPEDEDHPSPKAEEEVQEAVETKTPEEEPAPVFEHHTYQEVDDEDGDEPDETPDVDGKTAELTAKIAQLETAIGSIADTWEPDGTDGDDYSGTEAPAMAWEEEADTLDSQTEKQHEADYRGEPEPEPDVEPAPEAPEVPPSKLSDFSRVTGAFATHRTDAPHAEAEERPQPSAPVDLGSDEQVLDEEMLRDLVSEIVREELQGALGQRITRNVRKLVRREIHRALTAQDLE
ncbi:MAG: hypothetical protein HKN30_12220 [Sulfitobacter sp.]|nr:hypothetical protein [Sulfitobacter sp.]